MVGWSSLGPSVLDELDEFLSAGSEVDLVVDITRSAPTTRAAGRSSTRRSTFGSASGGPESLLGLVAEVAYDQAIVLGYREHVSLSEADARTLLTLLTLHRRWPAEGPIGLGSWPRCSTAPTCAVAGATGVIDFIVSDELSSLMIAQLSERLELHQVFDELFDAEGCLIALHPAPRTSRCDRCRFLEIVARLRQGRVGARLPHRGDGRGRGQPGQVGDRVTWRDGPGARARPEDSAVLIRAIWVI